MLPLLLDLPSYYKFHKVEKLWRVKTRVFSYIRVKKNHVLHWICYSHQVDFAYFFHLFCSWKQTTKSIFLVKIIVQKIVWGLLWFFFNDFSNENYSSTYIFFFKPKNWVVYLIPLELPSVNDGAFAIFFCIWLCSCQELFFALFHCTAITIFYTDILTRKVDIAIFFRVWNGWNNCKTNCEW